MDDRDEGLVSWGRVEELEAEIGKDDFAEVIEIFLEECDAAAARLPETEALEADLHFLRGAAMNLGLEALAAACQVGERAAVEGRGDMVDRAAIGGLYDASRTALLNGALPRAA